MEHLTKAAKERMDPHHPLTTQSKNLTQKPCDYKIPFSCHYVYTGQKDHQIPTRTYQGCKTRDRMVGSSQQSSKIQYNTDFDETEVLDTIYTMFPHYERSNKNIQTPL
jgi:hypothetical protein